MINQGEQNQKQEESTTLQKFTAKAYFIFCGTDQIDPVINRSIVSNIYQQIIEIIHFTMLYTIFGQTNNSTYDIIQTILSSSIILVCFVPRVMNKYYFLLFTLLIFVVITLASAGVSAILIINYYTFENYCSILSNYAVSNPTFVFKASNLCSSLTKLFYIEVAFSFNIEVFRIIYIYLIAKAYQAAKKKYNQEQKKRRRQEKFDENMKNKNPFNVKRKI